MAAPYWFYAIVRVLLHSPFLPAHYGRSSDLSHAPCSLGTLADDLFFSAVCVAGIVWWPYIRPHPSPDFCHVLLNYDEVYS